MMLACATIAELDWRALALPIARAEDALARLDERLAKSPIRDLVAAMVERRDFKECWRKTLPIFVSGADHAFQASFERQAAYSSPAPTGYKLARI